MDRMFSRTVRSRHSRNAGRISLKEQDTGRPAEYTGVCDLLDLRCIHPLPGSAADQRKRLFHSGTAGIDSCSGCFRCSVRLSFCEKRKEKSKIKAARRILMVRMRNAARIFYVAERKFTIEAL